MSGRSSLMLPHLVLALALLAGPASPATVPSTQPAIQLSGAAAAVVGRFRYSAPETPYLKELREEFRLDQVIAGAADDFDKARRLLVWARRQWEHDGDNMPQRHDALSILR